MRFRLHFAVVVAVALLALSACASSTNARVDGRAHSTSPAQLVATGPGGGVFHTNCVFSHSLPDDPIVHPGVPGASHMHNFFGNVSTNASSTLASLSASGTTCDIPQDHSGYWVPSLFFNGAPVVPTTAQVYYRDKVGGALETPPAGLEIVMGNAKATTFQNDLAHIAWTCSGAGMPGSATPPQCPAGSVLKMRIRFPDCWDGVHLDSTDHLSHMAESVNNACPAGHPVPLPQVNLEVKYPPGIDGRGTVTLASGSYYSEHGDWFNAWTPATLNLLVTRCINAGIDCGNTVPQSSPAPAPTTGYWMAGATGQVYGFGNARYFGGARTNAAVHIEPTPRRHGYWIVNAAGQVFGLGDAAWHGNARALAAGESVRSLSSTATGNGYWLFTSRGRVFSFGDAHPYGDMSGTRLIGPVVASVATSTGHGYYMVGSDGGIFAFGDARYHGSMSGKHLNGPVIALVPTSNGAGYWLVASDGGIFAFNAPFRGSTGGMHLNRPVIGMVRYGTGYLMVASDGGVFDFSNLAFVGSLAGRSLSAPIVGIAASS